MKFFAFLFFVMAFAGCKKGFNDFSIETPANDTVWALSNNATLSVNELHEALSTPVALDSFNLATGGTISFSNNTRIEIPAAAFTNGSNTAEGKALIEFQLLKRKGDLIRFRRPSTSNGYLLQTSGVVNINVVKNGQPLQLRAGRYLNIFYDDANPTSLMQAFYGISPNVNSFENFNWRLAQDSSLQVLPLQAGYRIITNRLQWINCDFFSDTAAQKSRTVLSMPRDFTNANTSAFIVFKNIRSVMQFSADVANRIWITQKVPVGKEVLYVTITKRKDEYWLGTTDATTAVLQNIHMVPEKKTLQALTNFLDGL